MRHGLLRAIAFAVTIPAFAVTSPADEGKTNPESGTSAEIGSERIAAKMIDDAKSVRNADASAGNIALTFMSTDTLV
jgi:hypothetical protein